MGAEASRRLAAGTTPRVVEVGVPAEVRPLQLLDRIDYEDAFSVPAAAFRTPEALLRDVLEGAPAWFLRTWSSVLFKGVLNYRLDMRASAERIAGWDIVADTGDVVVIGFDSPRGAKARLFAVVRDDAEIVGTLAQLD